MMKKIKFFVITFILHLFTLQYVFAQDEGPCVGCPTDIPIDGGISILIAVGISYGGYKLFKKKEIDEQNKKNRTLKFVICLSRKWVFLYLY